jgi:hypothetical protein
MCQPIPLLVTPSDRWAPRSPPVHAAMSIRRNVSEFAWPIDVDAKVLPN